MPSLCLKGRGTEAGVSPWTHTARTQQHQDWNPYLKSSSGCPQSSPDTWHSLTVQSGLQMSINERKDFESQLQRLKIVVVWKIESCTSLSFKEFNEFFLQSALKKVKKRHQRFVHGLDLNGPPNTGSVLRRALWEVTGSCVIFWSTVWIRPFHVWIHKSVEYWEGTESSGGG